LKADSPIKLRVDQNLNKLTVSYSKKKTDTNK